MISAMPTVAKPVPTLAGIALAVATLVGCTATTAPQATETPKPSATAVVEAATEATPNATREPASCSGMSEVYDDGANLYQRRTGTLKDLGAREFARGKVTLDADGVPVTYTVEAGDVEDVVAERLCAYPSLAQMNHVRVIRPGQVLWLTPDPKLPWIPYYSPFEAPAGFKQIPYQEAIEAAGRAVDAGDVATVRKIWNETLKPMFTNQETVTAVQKVVDSGDADGLRQLFS